MEKPRSASPRRNIEISSSMPGDLSRVDVGGIEELHRVAVARETSGRLAQPLHLAALEAERRTVHDRFVTDVEVVQPAAW